MCGIAGIWSANRWAASEGIEAMVRAQAHRGPDDEGCEAFALPSGFLMFGHSRLAIQDLSPAGHQPMENPATGDWIVFNGEIYNYPELRAELESFGVRFRSRCDTEAILHAFAQWGTDAFNRLNGMFALGLFAKARGQLILARDPLGIKPLYYSTSPDGFVFASELRGMIASGLVDHELDRRALASLLAYGAVPGPLTMLKHVRLQEPGSWSALNLSEQAGSQAALRPVRFWDFPTTAPTGTLEDVCDEIKSRLASAVRSHLISDVPVGLFLSSGMDSTVLAALCSEVRQGDIDTFTISLEEEPELDEGPIAAETARLLGARHHSIQLPQSEVRELIEDWLNSTDQPGLDGLNTYIIAHAVRRRGISVALSGLGGDEVFGGYETFRDIPPLARLGVVGRWFPSSLRRGVAEWLFRNKALVQRQKVVELAGGDLSLPSIYFRRRRVLSDLEIGQLGFRAADLGLNEHFMPAECEPERSLVASDPVSAVGVMECRFFMGNMLLRDSDVFGMAHGLEIRVPMLDRPLVEYLLSIPGNLRINRDGTNKPLLAKSVPWDRLSEVQRFPKRGFSLSQSRWMIGPFRESFEGLLKATSDHGLLDAKGVSAVWQRFLNEPQSTAWSRPWTLGVLGAWLNRYRNLALRKSSNSNQTNVAARQ